MKSFDFLRVKPALKSRSRLDLSFPHLTTEAIGQIQPLACKRLYPGDDWNVDAQYFSRVAPLMVPTYGRLDSKVAAFFVPCHQVAEDADAYFDGMTSYMGQTPLLRYFTVIDFHRSFLPQENPLFGAESPSVESDSSDFDFCISDSGSGPLHSPSIKGVDDVEDDSTTYYKLTPYGRWMYKFLSSLGYQFVPNPDENFDDNVAHKKLNAFPLLCACKAYNDWMSNSAKFNDSFLSQALLNIRQNKPVLTAGAGTSVTNWYHDGHLQPMLIFNLVACIKLVYESDYFSTAWLRPNSVAYSTLSHVTELQFQRSVNDNNGDEVALSTDMGTILAHNSLHATNLTSISQRGLQFLKSFDNWVRRNNFAGSRDVQQIYARFGIKPDYYRTHYAEVLGTATASMNVGDVMATSAGSVGTSGQSGYSENVLGEYAGKGIISGRLKFDCKASDHGYLIVLGWISVKASYPFGFDREVLRESPFDFYNPEFDGLSGDAISDMEVYSNPKQNLGGVTTDRSLETFGFTERYNDYRFSRDMITGDFRLYDTMKAWHFGRDLSTLWKSGENTAQSDSFMYYDRTGSQYNRIFNITDGSVDPIYTTVWFDISAIRPMQSLNEVPELGVGDVVVPKNGNVIN